MDALKKKNGNKHLTLVSTDENREVLVKYTELGNRIKNLIEYNSNEKINDGESNSIKAGKYEKEFM